MIEMTEQAIQTMSCRYGAMTFFAMDSVVSRSLREYGEWAQLEIDFLLQLIGAGDCVVDVGAFVGTHTLAFAQRVQEGGKVYAFEARHAFCEVLKKNIDENGLTNVTVFNVGLCERSDNIEVAPIDVSKVDNFGGTSLPEMPSAGDDFSSHEVIRMCTLDQLAIPKCTLIKIDAENLEMNVLQGARQTVRTARPLLFAECNSLEFGWPIVTFAKEEEYRSFVLTMCAYNPGNFRGNAINIFGDAREAGLLLVPSERISLVNDQLSDRDRQALIPVSHIDDLALALLKKPQYKTEVLRRTAAAQVLGNDFWANEPEVTELRKVINHTTQHSEPTVTIKTGTEIRIYIAGCDGYSEAASYFFPVAFGRWTRIEQEVPSGVRAGELRIDPADCPCSVEFEAIEIEGPGGKKLWSGEDPMGFSKLKFAGTAAAAVSLTTLVLLSYGDDPQVLIPLEFPGDIPVTIKVSFKVEASFQAFAEALKRVKESVQAKMHTVQVSLQNAELNLSSIQTVKASYETEIARLQDAGATLRAELHSAQTEVADLQGVSATMRAELHSAQTEIAGLQGVVATMRVEVNAAQAERGLLSAEISRVASEKLWFRHEREQAELETSRLRDQVRNLKSALQAEIGTRVAMEQSKSWRITSPMRSLMLRARNLLKRQKP